MAEVVTAGKSGVKRLAQSPSHNSSKRRLNPPHDISDISATREDAIDIRTQFDTKDCHITGSVVIDNNHLAVADNWNESVKVVDLNQKKVITHITLESVTFGVALVPGEDYDTLAVTVPIKRCIQFINVLRPGSPAQQDRPGSPDQDRPGNSAQQDRPGSPSLQDRPGSPTQDQPGHVLRPAQEDRPWTLTLGRRIKVHSKLVCDPYGICYSAADGGRLVVSFMCEDVVQVMDMSGTVLKTFSSYESGMPMFIQPIPIAIGKDERTVYVCSSSDESMFSSRDTSVTALTLDGEVKFVYKHRRLMGPSGIAVGDDGEIYVCDCDSSNLRVISSDGKNSKVLMKRKYAVMSPESLTYLDKKLYVGTGRRSKIIVFKVQHS